MLTKKFTIIKIPKNKCTYEFNLYSLNPKGLKTFKFGYNHKISKSTYFYNYHEKSIPYNESKYDLLYLKSPYLYNTVLNDDEYQIFEIVLSKEQLDNKIILIYNPTYYFQYLQKKIDEKDAQFVIGNITEILKKFYIYKDIAKIPPEIENLKNYHHEPIDLIDNLNKISTKYNTHLSLYQNIHKALYSVRDNHLNIRLSKIENNFDISNFFFVLLLNYILTLKKELKL